MGLGRRHAIGIDRRLRARTRRAKARSSGAYVVDHVFRAGYYQVAVRLKRRDKAVASATTAIQVQGGADFGR